MQNIAFLLLSTGVLLCYCEAIWTGKIYLGATGAIVFLLGLAGLWNLPHTGLGLSLIAAGVLSFIVEAAFRTYVLAGTGGTLCLAIGFLKLCPAAIAITAWLAIPISALFGVITVVLLASAKQARRNKRSDLRLGHR